MKHQKYVKEATQISQSEFYARMRWLPSKKPKYTIGDIVNFKNPEIVEDIATFEPSDWTGLIIAISVIPGQDFSYTIKYLDLWENGKRIEIHEGHIVSKL